IYFTEGSQLWLKPTSAAKYDIIKIDRVSNVTLIGPKVIGDRDKHLGTSGEWGNGIGIYSSSNIQMVNPRAYDCWGDGIYIGRRNTMSSKNIVLTSAYTNNNRRSGITIASVEDLTLDRPYAGYTNGKLPGCGINIEPNNSIDELKNINIISPNTKFNEGHGIQLTIGNLYSALDKKVNVAITGHVDNGSYYAFRVSNKMKENGGHLVGTISTTNASWKNNVDRPL